MVEFEKKTLSEKKKMSNIELREYNKSVREYNLKNGNIVTGIRVRKLLHPLCWLFIKVSRNLAGHTLKVYKQDDNFLKSNKPIIFAVTHIGKYDVEMASEAIGAHCYYLSGDEELLYRTFDGFGMSLNGVIFVDTEDKKDKNIAKETVKKYLNHGQNIMWFPEGIWNLSKNQLVLPLHYGIIEVAKETGARIVPVAVDQKEKDFYVNIGSDFDVDLFFKSGKDEKESKIEAVNGLRDQMATLKWQIWEQQALCKRTDIPDGYYEKFLEDRINEWPLFSMDDINRRVYKLPGVVEPEEAFAYLDKIQDMNQKKKKKVK